MQNPTRTSQIAQYMEYENRKMAEYSKLESQYNELQSKKQVAFNAKAPKIQKKEKTLSIREANIQSKLDNIYLQFVSEQEHCEKVKNDGIRLCEEKRMKETQEAEDNYHKAILLAEQIKQRALDRVKNHFESSTQYYNSQYDSMFDKAKRNYEAKKQMLESREETIKSEKSLIQEEKTPNEVSYEAQEQGILNKMNELLTLLKLSRIQDRITEVEAPPLPTLPGSIINPPLAPIQPLQYVPLAPVQPVQLHPLAPLQPVRRKSVQEFMDANGGMPPLGDELELFKMRKQHHYEMARENREEEQRLEEKRQKDREEYERSKRMQEEREEIARRMRIQEETALPPPSIRPKKTMRQVNQRTEQEIAAGVQKYQLPIE